MCVKSLKIDQLRLAGFHHLLWSNHLWYNGLYHVKWLKSKNFNFLDTHDSIIVYNNVVKVGRMFRILKSTKFDIVIIIHRKIFWWNIHDVDMAYINFIDNKSFFIRVNKNLIKTGISCCGILFGERITKTRS